MQSSSDTLRSRKFCGELIILLVGSWGGKKYTLLQFYECFEVWEEDACGLEKIFLVSSCQDLFYVTANFLGRKSWKRSEILNTFLCADICLCTKYKSNWVRVVKKSRVFSHAFHTPSPTSSSFLRQITHMPLQNIFPLKFTANAKCIVTKHLSKTPIWQGIL